MAEAPLLKALCEAGIGSRRKMADAICEGRVTVNGQVAENFKLPVDIDKDRITLDGKPVSIAPSQAVYLMVNKPKGFLSTTEDERGRKTVIDLLPPAYRNIKLYPVGRLDMDSIGLLLLTNDGDLTYRLTHPKFEHEKEYLISIQGKLSPEAKKELEKGVELEDGVTYPAAVREVDQSPYNYSLTIHEGRKRQVRRMLESLGHRVTVLQRVRMGKLILGDLKPGAVRKLRPDEIRELLRAVGS